ncbi:hypothetical protein ABK040_011848 [Willaertia magna]
MSQQKKEKSKKGATNIKNEETLKAIVFSSISFTKELRPITIQKPRSLLPLNNVPIIEYVLELLASSNVKEVYVFVCHGADLIKAYRHQVSKTQRNGDQLENEIKVEIIEAQTATSIGDALRLIHEMDIIRSDFVLVQGDVISNINLQPIVEQHKLERKNNPQVLMTIWVGLSPKNNQLIYYENDKKETMKLDIELKKFDEHHDNIEIRTDLMDCHIDICSPEVLGIFQDNFDFQDLRTDFLRKNYVLTEEIVSYKSYTVH